MVLDAERNPASETVTVPVEEEPGVAVLAAIAASALVLRRR